MKRIIALVLIVVMAFSLSACTFDPSSLFNMGNSMNSSGEKVKRDKVKEDRQKGDKDKEDKEDKVKDNTGKQKNPNKSSKK